MENFFYLIFFVYVIFCGYPYYCPTLTEEQTNKKELLKRGQKNG